jgi:hypothetical protein
MSRPASYFVNGAADAVAGAFHEASQVMPQDAQRG